MGQSWDRRAAGAVSDAIPNEFSKLNSYSKYLSYIPYVGWALKAISNTASGVDRFGETYSNGGNLGDSLSYGASAYQDTSGDPNKYSPKNDSFQNGDAWLKAGKIGEALPGSKTDYGSAGRGVNLIYGAATNQNSHQSEHGPGSPGYNSNSFDMSSMGNMGGMGGSSGSGGLGGISMPGGQGGGQGVGDIMNMFSSSGNSSQASDGKPDELSLMNMFKNENNLETEDLTDEKKFMPKFTYAAASGY